ncbi:MAG: hypothetical protein KGQ36_06140 [Rickettsiales bacterium]|nr:hypothetical protein [Rickettsiales bacterium]
MAEKISNKHHNFMTTTTFETLPSFITKKGVDTLMISKLLRQVNFSEEQAEIVSEIVKHTNLNSKEIVREEISEYKEEVMKDMSQLATKSDIKEIELDIKELELKIEQTKSDLIKWVAGLMIANTGLLFTLIKFFN